MDSKDTGHTAASSLEAPAAGHRRQWQTPRTIESSLAQTENLGGGLDDGPPSHTSAVS